MATSRNPLDFPLTEEAPRRTKDTQAALARSHVEFAKAEAKSRDVVAKLRTQHKVPVTLAPMYRPYFGDVMAVYLNGFPIFVPVDGRTYQVPVDYAKIVQKRRRRVDDHIMRRQVLADVQRNMDQTNAPGTLELIPK